MANRHEERLCQQDDGGVLGAALRAPTEADREARYWAHHREWFTFDEDGNPRFLPDTPKRVLDSFRMMHRSEGLEAKQNQPSVKDEVEG